MTLARGFFGRERSVLLLMLFASLVAHGGAFLLVGIADQADVGGWRARSRVHVMQPALELGLNRQPLYLLADRLDPSLLALPSPWGFSNRMWKKTIPLGFQSQPWQVPLAYLEPPPAPAVTNLLPQPAVTETLQAAIPVELNPPDSAQAQRIPTVRAENRSTLQLFGGLEKRAVVRSPTLPAITQPGGVRPTSVRIGVGGDGLVKYASLDRGSGNETADAAALAAVRQIQFAPAGGDAEELQWGLVRFYWALAVPAPAPAAPEAAAP
jgi:TonB family protein